MRSRKSKQEHWRRHVALGQQYACGVAAYCRENNLSIPSYHYWKRKLSGPNALPEVVESPFVPVSVTRVERARLPDPEWLARFVSEIARSV